MPNTAPSKPKPSNGNTYNSSINNNVTQGSSPTSGSNNSNSGSNKTNRRQRKPTNKNASKTATGANTANKAAATSIKGTILVLHGNRQTGQLLLGRIDRLAKRLQSTHGLQCIAPDAPHKHPEDPNLQTWWELDLDNNIYTGLEQSLQVIRQAISHPACLYPVVGLIGFSQGARMAHLLALLHSSRHQQPSLLPDLRFCIFVAGYDAPLPKNFETSSTSIRKDLPSLHVYGMRDALVTPQQSQALRNDYYHNAQTLEHDGNHFVPSKGPQIQSCVDFVTTIMVENVQKVTPIPSVTPTTSETLPNTAAKSATIQPKQRSMLAQPIVAIVQTFQEPDDETKQLQQDEIQALEAIYPDEFTLLSNVTNNNPDDEFDRTYSFPISFSIQLSKEDDGNANHNWPPQILQLSITFPHDYPTDCIANIALDHHNNVYEFPYLIQERLITIVQEAAREEIGMSNIMACVVAAQDFLNGPKWVLQQQPPHLSDNTDTEVAVIDSHQDAEMQGPASSSSSILAPSSPAAIQNATLEGLCIAKGILQQYSAHSTSSSPSARTAAKTATPTNLREDGIVAGKQGGSFWTYTIGLVGKPSAGKSTFFNAATAFARQGGQENKKQQTTTDTSDLLSNSDDDNDNGPDGDGDGKLGVEIAAHQLGGASMAPHPFTTIDPNIGFCLVPAPDGSCPEDALETETERKLYGSTHGRAPDGRRFLPVLLKDVAGLVPGAYQGRGRGNQFLNDLCDAHVLIHVVDASGTADAQGNKTASGRACPATVESTTANGDQYKANEADYTDPISDLAWIRTELVEWVTNNLLEKWDSIQRKGQLRLASMLSGYGQSHAATYDLCAALEKFVAEKYQRSHILDHINEWNQADVHRFVSAFLGVRFPMALALNKCDLPSSKQYIAKILSSLPIHGAHVGTPMGAIKEMAFIRKHLLERLALDGKAHPSSSNLKEAAAAEKQGRPATNLEVWNCLTKALQLKEPLIVFPVSDLSTFAPMQGMDQPAVGSPSLPSPGMITCIRAAGGNVPSSWDASTERYFATATGVANTTTTINVNAIATNATKGGGEKRNDTGKRSPHRTGGHKNQPPLRDFLLMRPGSTIEDVFLSLKRLGALSGDFVRAEACGDLLGDKPKPVPKNDVLGRHNRIIKIQTTKRTQWQ